MVEAEVEVEVQVGVEDGDKGLTTVTKLEFNNLSRGHLGRILKASHTNRRCRRLTKA